MHPVSLRHLLTPKTLENCQRAFNCADECPGRQGLTAVLPLQKRRLTFLRETLREKTAIRARKYPLPQTRRRERSTPEGRGCRTILATSREARPGGMAPASSPCDPPGCCPAGCPVPAVRGFRAARSLATGRTARVGKLRSEGSRSTSSVTTRRREARISRPQEEVLDGRTSPSVTTRHGDTHILVPRGLRATLSLSVLLPPLPLSLCSCAAWQEKGRAVVGRSHSHEGNGRGRLADVTRGSV